MSEHLLPHLETFRTAAELGSFTATARVLGLTQAAVSQRIQVLEQDLGVSLFQRRGGRVWLSDAGRCLADFAQQIRALHQQARAELTGRKTPPAGELFLAASSVPGEHLLPQILPRFHRRYPHIQVRVTVTDSQSVFSQLERAQANAGLVGEGCESPHLACQPFARDELVVVVPRRHRWGRQRQVSLEQFCRQPLILRAPGSGARHCLEQALARAGKSLSDLSVSLEIGSNEGIKEAVQRGLGVAVLSAHAVSKEVRSGALHALRVRSLPLERELYLVWDRRRALPIPAQLFRDFLTQPASRP